MKQKQLKSMASLFVVLLGLFIAAEAWSGQPQGFAGAPKNSTLTISLNRKDPNTVTIKLVNISKGALYILDQLGLDQSNVLGIHVKNIGTGENYDAWLSSDPAPPPPTSKEAFLRLLPGESCEVDVKLDQQLSKSGKYELRALYESPIDSHSPLAFGLPMWGHEKGIIASTPIEVTVD